MKNHVKDELRAFIPMLLGILLMAGICIYFSNLETEVPFYSPLLVGIGLSMVLGLWFNKVIYFVFGILLSTPAWSIYIFFAS